MCRCVFDLRTPRADVLAYFSPERAKGSIPASVTLYSVPDMRMLQQKNLFSVENCGLKWHPDGTFLCLQFNKIHGKKRTACLELFRLTERDVPSETLEFPDTKVVEFTWEPKGNRFSVVHTTTNTFRSTISFYTMGDSKHELLCTCGVLSWCVVQGGGAVGSVLCWRHPVLGRSLLPPCQFLEPLRV